MRKIIRTGLYVEGIEVTSEHLGSYLSVVEGEFDSSWQDHKCKITHTIAGSCFRIEGRIKGIRHGCWIYNQDEANHLLWKTNPSKDPNKTTSNEGNHMTQLNYKADWYMECPRTKEQWEIFVSIMKHFGVVLPSYKFSSSYDYITPYAGVRLHRTTAIPSESSQKVSLLKALCLLQRPLKTEQQIKIEELEKTILEAQQQIQQIKNFQPS